MKFEELKDFTDEQLENIKKVIQSETDKVRTDYSKQIKELEQYKPKEKPQAEIELENRLKVLEDKERAIAQKERNANIQSKLKEKGLSTKLSKYLRVDDDNFDSCLDEFAQVINSQILDGSYKPKVHKENKGVITKEQFATMGYFERAKLAETNPTLYAKLSE